MSLRRAPRWVRNAAWLAFIALVLVLTLWPLLARAAPKAHPAECEAFWDMAITARAMALERASREQILGVFRRVWQPTTEMRIKDIQLAIAEAAMRERNMGAAEFANRLAHACVSRMGDMDAVLGSAS